MTVLIQAGHEGIQTNCQPALRPGTGAHDEIVWTPDVAQRVVNLLVAHGVSAIHVNANANCDAAYTRPDWEAAVAIHYQSDPPHESGYFCGVGDPKTDGAADRSWALCEAIRAQYEAVTHLQPRGNWDSENITFYYLFEALSSKTPFALIECGTGAPGAPDHQYLWSHKDDVARGIANGVLAFLGKATIPATPPVVVPPVEGSPAEEATETPAAETVEDAPPPPPPPPAEGSPAEEATETPSAEASEDAPPAPPEPLPEPAPPPVPPVIHPDVWGNLAGEIQDLIIKVLEHFGLVKS